MYEVYLILLITFISSSIEAHTPHAVSEILGRQGKTATTHFTNLCLQNCNNVVQECVVTELSTGFR